LRGTDDRIDEARQIFAVGREAVGVGIRIWQFGGIAHADQIRRDQAAISFQFGNDVAPKIGRGRVAMQKQHRRSLAALVIGHAATQHIDGLFCEWLFCHRSSRSIGPVREHAARLKLTQIAAAAPEDLTRFPLNAG